MVAALGSWLDARANDGLWLLRIEDLDPPREDLAAADSFLRDLDRLGLYWDGQVTYQSNRLGLYEDALQGLLGAGLAYRCRCSRLDIERTWKKRPGTPRVYPGTCRNANLAARQGSDEILACRLNVAACPSPRIVEFTDRFRGPQRHEVAAETGDFVLKRRDGLHAYQLAVVVDDQMQGVTDVVRGADLIDNTARQIVLQHALEYRTPRYAHLPVVLNQQGQKLSKQSGAKPIDAGNSAAAIRDALEHLGLAPPADLNEQTPSAALTWARDAWRRRQAGQTACSPPR